MSDDRYDNLLEAAIQRCSEQIARDVERQLYELYNRKLCIICKKTYHEFEDEGHPFCKDNLEYLEWKAENH